MFVFFVSKIIFLLFFSQTFYTLCLSIFDFVILFIEKVGAIGMNSFISPPSKRTHLHDMSVLCLLSTSLTERPAQTPGLKILPLYFLIFPSLFFHMSFPLSAQQSHYPHGLLTPCFKKTFLNPTYSVSYCFVSLLLQSVANVIYFKKERVMNGIECYWEVKGSQNWTHERAPIIHCVHFHIYSSWPPQSSFCPITPLKLLLSGYPRIPSSHILCILILLAIFNAVESCLLKILIVPKAEPETKTCR